jgi:hypothetical protein
MIKTAGGILLVIVLAYGGYRLYDWWGDRREAERTRAEQDKEREAAVVASLRDSLAQARKGLVRVDTIVRRVLTAPPPPPRPTVPSRPVLDTLARDSLVSIIVAQDLHIDTLQARLITAVTVLDTTFQALTRYQLFADSTINAQARQIIAMQRMIDNPPRRRRLGIGGCAGYVIREPKTGAGLCIGGTFTLF